MKEDCMNLGVQYYRPPFPEDKYWEKDFIKIKQSGFNTVQLWVLWGWVEPKPNHFVFDDYDRLVKLAEQNGLGVILSTIAEIQPYWIHREVPGSEMINHIGQKVVSSNRNECHFGITPGGCTDNPGVWEHMQHFFTEVVSRYRSVPNLRGWDAWNELRWNVHADGFVCYCDYTLQAFRKWLSDKYGGLEGLNKAWKRRYSSFEEVMPGKLPDRPYTEMMAFERFLTWRANRHAKARYEVIKALDMKHPVTVHAASPCALWPGSMHGYDHPLNRGNDWFFADDLDGVGCSSFPKWSNMDDADFAMRVEFVKSAGRDKLVWLSEVQGGRAAVGFNIYADVDALSQQRWIWNGIACGADTILFWCWRDEVFGRESGGFGISGYDDLAEERLEHMKVTGKLIEDYGDMIAKYRPARSEIGVMFSPQSYYLAWAQEGSAERIMRGLLGYCRSLARQSMPYTVVEEEHLDVLHELKVLFMPRTIVTSESVEETLAEFVKKGGTLVCESECGAFNPEGLYRYPEDRFTTHLTGVNEVGRRHLESDYISAVINDEKLNLKVAQWLTPWQKNNGIILAENKDGALISEVSVGKGRVVLCGSYLGDPYLNSWTADFERFIELTARKAGWEPWVEVSSPKPDKDSFVYVKWGESAGKKVVFVFFPPKQDSVHLRFKRDFFASKRALDIISGRRISVQTTETGQECMFNAPEWRFSVLVEE
ncbi:MAG: beta-galactosidase [Candidatus Bathyarchaeia archaeon]